MIALTDRTLQDFYDGYDELWETGYTDEHPSKWSAGEFYFLGRLAEIGELVDAFQNKTRTRFQRNETIQLVIEYVTEPGTHRDGLIEAVAGMFEDLEPDDDETD